MMTLEQAIAKAAKLLKLSESSNANEAALAAQRAQEILTRYDIDRAAVNAQSESSEPDEEIMDFGKRAPLDQANQRLSRWKGMLASRLSQANQCKAYQWGNVLGIIGRPSDVEKVRYLYDLLVREIDRLTEINGKGCGRNWRTEFRYGVVEAINEKLVEAKKKVVADMRSENTGTALVRVNQAIAKIEAKDKALSAWVAKNSNLKTRKTYVQPNDTARAAGYEAGKSISISGARGSLAAGSKQLK